MLKSEIAARISQRLRETGENISEKDVYSAVCLIIEQMSDCLSQSGRIEIRGFGSFAVRQMPSRSGRNPKTGELVVIPTRRKLHFRAGKELSIRVNQDRPCKRT